MVNPNFNVKVCVSHMREPMFMGELADLIFNRFPSLFCGTSPEPPRYLSHSTAISNNIGDSSSRLHRPDIVVWCALYCSLGLPGFSAFLVRESDAFLGIKFQITSTEFGVWSTARIDRATFDDHKSCSLREQ